MNSFTYYKPTRIIHGNGEFNKLGQMAALYGKRALLLEDVGPLEELGVYARAIQYLEEAGLSVVYLKGITANPKLTKIDEGIKFAREEKVDIIIAVGGGSAIDTAKSIALGVPYDGDVWDFFTYKAVPQSALPVGVVSTIAGTGSETDNTSVVTNDRTIDPEKWECYCDLAIPRFAIMDPELHATVPPRLTAPGMADSITHAAEAYFFDWTPAPFQDQYVEGLVKTIISCEGVLEDPGNLELRGLLCWTSSLAIDRYGNVGRYRNPLTNWPAHFVQSAIGAMQDSRHGDGLAVLLPAVMMYANRVNPCKTKRFAINVFGVDPTGKTDQEIGMEGIKLLQDKFMAWGLPITLQQLGVSKDLYPAIKEKLLRHPHCGKLNNEFFDEVLAYVTEK